MFDYIAHGAFKIGKVDRLVQSHLYRADEFGVHIHRLQQFVWRSWRNSGSGR